MRGTHSFNRRSVGLRGAPVALIMGALCGCTMGPDYHAPPSPAVTGYTAEPLPRETAAGPEGDAQRFVADMDIPGQWWTVFQSPALNAVVAQALQNNPDVGRAQAALRAAQENASVEKALAYPNVAAGASASREKLSVGTLGPPTILSPFSLVTAAVLVSYPLDVFGERRRRIESAEAQAEERRFQLEATYVTLTTNVVVAAVEEAALRGRVAAVEEIAAVERKQADLLKHENELGNEPQAAVLAQAAELAETEAESIGLRKALDRQHNVLTALAGRFPGDSLADHFDLASLTLPRDIPVSLPSLLVEHRPDVRAAQAHLHASNAEIGVVEAEMFPQIILNGGYGGAATSIAGVPDAASWLVQTTATQPISGLFALGHERRAAKAERDEAEAIYRKTVLTAFHDVSDVLHALDWDAQALKTEADAEQASAQQLTLLQKQLAAGDISELALLDATRSARRARVAVVTAQAARLTDTAALFQALGGGWWNLSDRAANQHQDKP